MFRGKKQRDQHLISHRQWGMGVLGVSCSEMDTGFRKRGSPGNLE